MRCRCSSSVVTSFCTALDLRGIVAETISWFTYVVPVSRCIAERVGNRIVSSWSCPTLLCPRAVKVPTTVNGTPLIKIVWPTGLPPPGKRLLHDGLAEDCDLGGRRDVALREERPDRERPVAHERVGRRDPGDRRLPVVVAGDRPGCGASPTGETAATPGKRAIAIPSPAVRVDAPPLPLRAPLCDDAAGHDDQQVAAEAVDLLLTETRAPAPIAIVTMTAATPMTTPSIVRIERARLRKSARTERRTIAKKFIGTRASSRAWSATTCPSRNVTMRFAYAATSGSWVTSMIVMPRSSLSRVKSCHDVLRRLRVERAGRLVGQDQTRVVDERTRDRDPLLLAARELARVVVGARRAIPTTSSAASRGGAPPRFGDAGVHHRQLDVLERRRARQQVVGLEDEAEAAAADVRQLVGREMRDVAPFEEVRPPTSARSSSPAMCMNVDLPEPEGPITATNSPLPIVRSTWSSATTGSSPSA